MNKVTFDGEVILDIEKIVNSDTVKGIEVATADPGDLDNNIVYLVFNSSKLYVRYNSYYYEIGDPVQV